MSCLSRALILSCAVCCWVAPAAAQEPARPDQQAEVAALERALARVDEALTDLKSVEACTTVHYDVRQLLERAPDHPSETLALAADSMAGGGGGFSFSWEDEEPEYNTIDPDQLEMIVSDTVGEDCWDDPASIQIHRGWLIVRQTARHHAQIRELLAALRHELEGQAQLECGRYRLPPALARELHALAADGALGPAALKRLDDAVQAGLAELQEAVLLQGRDGQVLSVTRVRQRAYLGDVEQSSGGTGQVVEQIADPIVETLSTGLAVQARLYGPPQRVTLQVRWITSRLLGVETQTSDFGRTEVEVPRVARQVIRGSAQVPSGSGALLHAENAAEGGELWLIGRPRLTQR